QRQLKHAGLVVVVLDDYAKAGHYCADLLWNADLPADENRYQPIDSPTKLLLGPKYALLRREFLDFPRASRSTPEFVRNLLITMGGSDPENMTATVLRSLGRGEEFQIRAIVGSSNPNADEVRRIAESMKSVEVLTSVGNMPSQMAWADMAVVAAGVTVWELLFMGVPVMCWPRYPEDFELVSEFGQLGAAWPLPQKADSRELASLVNRLAADGRERQRMSDAGRRLVDGRGAERVIRELSEVIRPRLDIQK